MSSATLVLSTSIWISPRGFVSSRQCRCQVALLLKISALLRNNYAASTITANRSTVGRPDNEKTPAKGGLGAVSAQDERRTGWCSGGKGPVQAGPAALCDLHPSSGRLPAAALWKLTRGARCPTRLRRWGVLPHPPRCPSGRQRRPELARHWALRSDRAAASEGLRSPAHAGQGCRAPRRPPRAARVEAGGPHREPAGTRRLESHGHRLSHTLA